MKTMKLYLVMLCVSATTLLSEEHPWLFFSKPAETSHMAWTRYAIEGYALPTSVKPGETIRFYVSVCDSGTEHKNYSIKIFRVPDTATVLYTSSVIAGRFYYLHDSVGNPIGLGDYSRKPVDFRNGCTKYWDSTAVSVSIPSNWRSGLYYAQLEHKSDIIFQKWYYVPFIVRTPAPGDTSKIIFKYDFTTNQAYSYWGGGSLYSNTQDGSLTITDTIAIDRPMWFPLSNSIKYGYANEFIKTLEDSGMVMEYCNNIDVDSSGLGLPFLSNYKTLVLWQHDEYWTQRERNVTEEFMGRRNNSNGHGNLARFAQNTCYWRIKWLNGGHLQLSCDKWWKPDAYSELSQFRLIDFTNPEGKFLGSQYERYWNQISEDSRTEEPSDSVVTPAHWIFSGLGLDYGDTLGYGWYDGSRWHGLLATELDNTTQLNGKADYPTTILAKRYVRSHKDTSSTDLVLHQMIYYEDTTTNSRVFGLGAGGLSNALYNSSGNDRTKVQQMVVNIMSHFSEKKFTGNVYAAYDFPLLWNTNISLDGNVLVLPGRRLQIAKSPTISIDSVLFIEGELEINDNANVTLAGTGSLNINSTGVLRIKSGATLTVKPAAFVLEQGAQIIYENGAKLVIKNATVKDHATLTVDSGGELKVDSGGTVGFGTGGRLCSYGKFIATNAAFTSLAGDTAGSWGSIELNGSGAAYSDLENVAMSCGTDIDVVDVPYFVINNSAITNCINGVDCHDALGWVTRNTIENPRDHGIVVQDNSNTSCYFNTITKSDHAGAGIYFGGGASDYVWQNYISGFNWGIGSIWGADVFLGHPNNADQNNEVTGCLKGIEVNNEAYMHLDYCEDEERGHNYAHNAIYDNALNAHLYYQGEAYANHNYWGFPADSALMSCDGTSYVDYSDPLEYFPWSSSAKRAAGTINQFSTSESIVPPAVGLDNGSNRPKQISNLNLAMQLKVQKRYTEAAALLLQMVQSNEHVVAALLEIRNMDNDTLRPLVISSLQTTVTKTTSALPKHLLAQLMLKNHDVAAAKQLNREINAGWSDSPDARQAKIALLRIALYEDNDDATAKSILEDLMPNGSQSDDIELNLARHAIETFHKKVQTTAPEGMKKSSNGNSTGKNESKNDLPTAYELHQNYPNPFNPVTTINYDLPEASPVTVKIYDYIGREVIILVDSYKTAGRYQARFDAGGFGSGVYFYRLQAGSYTSVKKMLLLK